jgi:Protein kinase domain
MAALNPRLADLSDLDRLVLESWLVEFDQRWDEGILANRVDQIPRGSSWRLPALAEMVKIDLERQWQRGRQVSLESYLKDFPELGSPADVSADLIQAEYDVRRQFGAPAALEDYIKRFPGQAGELARLIAQGGSSLSRRSSSGVAKPDDKAQELPDQFGRYRILERLGQGGMGSVHLAEDTQLQRRVALKVANFGTQESPDARRRLLAEARAAATLDHPYLCPVYDAGEIDGRLYLTMAYIEGQSLAESTRGKSLPPRNVAALVGKLAVVTIDGKISSVKWLGGKGPAKVTVPVGDHRVKVELNGVEVFGEEVRIETGRKK